ncbi:hypothetical protein D210916BOD24_23350 [Alteromonas sp. D210916BOD_24]|uniref:AAA family ATPase n=1 Tax=Alteromonas sp. D210916BOD_24 TaxID=3157618 RepID=UPI00399CF6A3
MLYNQQENLIKYEEVVVKTGLASLNQLTSYSPIVIRDALSNTSLNKFLKATAFLQCEETITYLLQSEAPEAQYLAPRAKHFVTSTLAEAELAYQNLIKQLERSKHKLLSQGERQASVIEAECSDDFYKLHNYGRQKLISILPLIDDDTLTLVVYSYKNSLLRDGLLNILPAKRRNKIMKEVSQITHAPENVLVSSINIVIRKLETLLRTPAALGFSVQCKRKSYIERAINSTAHVYAQTVDKVLNQQQYQCLAKAFSLLEEEQVFSFIEYLEPRLANGMASNIENANFNSQLSNGMHQRVPSYTSFNIGLKHFNKIIRDIHSHQQELVNSPKHLESPEQEWNAESFEQINQFDESVWYSMLKDTNKEIITDATVYCCRHSSMLSFNKFLAKQKCFLDYENWKLKHEVSQAQSIEAQKIVIEQCQQFEGDFRQMNLDEAQQKIKKLFRQDSVNELFEGMGFEGGEDNARRNSEIVKRKAQLFNVEELEAEILMADNRHQIEVLELIKQKGACKELIYPPRDYVERMETLRKQFPNFEELINFIEDCLREADFANEPVKLPVINLDGQPGIGKSQVVAAISTALSVAFNTIPVSTMGGPFEVLGAHKTWKGAELGAIAKACLLNSDHAQVSILIDEVCLVKSEGEHNIAPSLYGLFESEQRKRVKENFMGVHVDFSYLLMFTTTNDIDNLLPALRSRLKNFTISAPDKSQMRVIGQNIYHALLEEKKLFQFFEPDVPQACFYAFEKLTPRSAKSAIDQAIKQGLKRADRQKRFKVSLQPSDFTEEEIMQQSHSIGFIH